MSRTRSGRRLRAEANLSGAIYGVITATAVIAATAGHGGEVGTILAATAATLVVFWLAHVYAAVVAHHLHGQLRPSLSVVRAAMVRELPVVEAPALSILALLAGTVGLLDPGLAIGLALWAGPVQLVAAGVAYARQQGWPWLSAAVAGVVNGALGAGIIVLKALLH
jgi:hypothetical protein